MAQGRLGRDRGLAAAVSGMVDDPDPSVRYQLALAPGELPGQGRTDALAALASGGAGDPYLLGAVLSSVGDEPLALYQRTSAGGAEAPGTEAFLARPGRR